MNQTLLSAENGLSCLLPYRVMVVEDDPVVRRLLRLRLHRIGLSVVAASTGEEAMAICEADPQPFNLVITDGVMPGIDGFEVARYLLNRVPQLPVILLSGYLNHFISRPDIPENIVAFFEKPFLADELSAKVLELLGVVA